MKRILVIFLIASIGMGLMVFADSSAVYGCSCVGPLSVSAQFERSDAVFTGQVMEVKEQKSSRGYMTKAVLFEIERYWKGGTQTQISIQTGNGGGDCGMNFEPSQDYLVYAQYSQMYGDVERLVTIICDRTKERAAAQEDLMQLGDGYVPTERVNLKLMPNDGISFPLWSIAAAILAGIGLLALLLWRIRRH